MKFETNPRLILTKDEFDTLDEALKLCRDMNEQTGGDRACEMCPIQNDCTCMCLDCMYERASSALKEIIDIAIIK